MDYLRDEQYYIDRYDLLSIESCLRWIEVLKARILKDREEVNDFKLADTKGFVGALGELTLYFRKGEEYRDKEKTINKWKESDRVKQEKYDNTKIPSSVFCENCNWAMEFDGKTLHDFSDEPMRMLFFFRCPKCRKGKGIFEDGEIYKPKKHLCPKCGTELKEERKRNGEVITTIETCGCGYNNKDVWDMKADEERFKKQEDHEKRLLQAFRGEFCLTKEEGDKYVTDHIQTEQFLKHEVERKTKEADPRYQKAKNLKRVKVVELQKIIQDVSNANGFNQLNFDKPEIDKYVIVSFSVQETKVDRSDYDSSRDLRRALTKALEGTNWRLMSDGISNRLGLLYGKIKGYENEDDLMKII